MAVDAIMHISTAEYESVVKRLREFLEGFSNPVYSYQETSDEHSAIAAFMSMPREEVRKEAQRAVDRR
jgi:hypothetical protein